MVASTTYMATEIEGSARLWEEDPATMVAVNARHDAIVENVIASNGGVVDWTRAEGSGDFARFSDPVAAVQAAVDLHIAIADEAWAGGRVVQLRVALHTSSADPSSELIGPVINRAARLRDLGHGGQILLSSATAEALEGVPLPGGCSLFDLGTHRLKDLSQPERVLQLRAPSMPETFPALNTPDRLGHNLPPWAPGFVGSAASVVDILESARLVTLVGPPGIGKSRTALEVAWSQVGSHEGGVWWVRVGDDTSTDGIATGLLRAMGAPESPDAVAALAGAIGTKAAVVVLDGCERATAASTTLLRAILAACPRGRGLVTSWAPLHVPGERLVPISPLPVDGEAMELLAQRVKELDPSFEAGDVEIRQEMKAVCAAVDGIPLALELVAADVARLGTREALVELRRSSAETSPLHAAVTLSVGALDEATRNLFMVLGAFTGSFSLEAVEAVAPAGGVATDDVSGLMQGLANRSLVSTYDAAAVVRFGLLDTLRSHGLRMLTEAGVFDDVRLAHLEWYVGLGRRAEQVIGGPASVAGVDMFELEHENVHHALRWDPGPDRRAVALQVELGRRAGKFWQLGYHLHEGRRSLDAALSRVDWCWSERASARVAAASLASLMGDDQAASEHADAALADLDEVSVRVDASLSEPAQREAMQLWISSTRNRATAEVAQALLRLGHIDQSIARFEDLLASAAELPMAERLKTRALFGEALSAAGHHDRARAEVTETREGFERLGMVNDARRARITLAGIELRLGNPAAALRESLEMRDDSVAGRDPWGAARAASNLAECAMWLDRSDAPDLSCHALDAAEKIGVDRALAAPLWIAAEGALKRDHESALKLAHRCLDRTSDPVLRALALSVEARACGNPANAMAIAQRAVSLLEVVPPSSDVVAVLSAAVEVAARSSDTDPLLWIREASKALRAANSLVAADRLCLAASKARPRFAPILLALVPVVRGILFENSSSRRVVDRVASVVQSACAENLNPSS